MKVSKVKMDFLEFRFKNKAGTNGKDRNVRFEDQLVN